MLIKEGTIVQGSELFPVEAQGHDLEALEKNVEAISAKYKELGDNVHWENAVFEKTEIQIRSDVFEVVRDIPRKHLISVQRDSMLPGDKKWLAAHKNHSAYGKTKDEAVEAVVKLITFVGYGDYV